MPTIPVTDYNGMYGVVDFFMSAWKADIKPLIWVELTIVQDIDRAKKMSVQDVDQLGTLCLLAKNIQWYHDLLEIESKAATDYFHHKPLIDYWLLSDYTDNLIAFTWGQLGLVGVMIREWATNDLIDDRLKQLQQLFGKDFYLEILAQDYSLAPDLQKINTLHDERAQQLWIDLVTNNNFHYIHPHDKEAYEMALAIKDGKKMYEDDRRKVVWDYHIFSEDEMRSVLTKNWYTDAQIDTMFANNVAIAEQCDVTIELWQMLFPNYESPEDITALYEKYHGELVE